MNCILTESELVHQGRFQPHAHQLGNETLLKSQCWFTEILIEETLSLIYIDRVYSASIIKNNYSLILLKQYIWKTAILKYQLASQFQTKDPSPAIRFRQAEPYACAD